MDWKKVKQHIATTTVEERNAKRQAASEKDVEIFEENYGKVASKIVGDTEKNSYISSAETNANQSALDALERRRQRAEEYIKQNEKNLENPETAKDAFKDYGESIENLDKANLAIKDYWGQFGSEEGYNDYLNQIKEQERLEYMNIKEARDKKSALEEELEELENLAKEQVGEAGTAAIVAAGIRNRKNSVDALVDADNLKKRKALEKEISDLAKDIILASRIQQGKYVTKRATEASDFEKFSQEAPEEKKVETIAPHAQNIKREDSAVKYMSEQQRAIYNYYLNKFGKKKAEEYLDIIRDDLNQEQAKAIYSGNEDKVLNQLLIQAASGFEQAKSGFQGTARAFLGDESNQPVTTSEYLSQMADEDLADFIKLPSWVTNITGWESVGQIAGDVIKTTTNMIPSIAVGMATGGIGGALAIGASSGGNSYNEAIREGFSIEQARNYAVLTGISETTLSYVLGGIGALGGKAAHKFLGKKLLNIDGALKKVARVIPTNYIAEGAEEYLQEILNPIFRNLIFEEDNEIDLRSPDAIASFILGGLSSVGFSVGETVYANYDAKQTYKDKESMDALIESGLESADDTVAHKLAAIAKEKIESGKNLSGGEIRKLENANEEAIAKEQERAQEDAGVVVAKNATVDSAEPKTASAKADADPRDSILVYKGKTARDVADIQKIAASFEHATKDTPGQIAALYNKNGKVSAEEFSRGVSEAYRYGASGISIEEMNRNGSFVRSLEDYQRTSAYYLGQNNAEKAIAAQAQEQQKKVLPGIKGKVVLEGRAAIEVFDDPKQTSVINFIDKVLAKASGIEYHVFSSFEKDGKRVYINSRGETISAPNGFYAPETRQIWIDLHAGSEADGKMLYTLTHEHVHDIKVWSAQHYNKLVKITAEAFSKSGKSFEEAVAVKLEQYRKNHPETDLETAREEVVAETMSGLLQDGKALAEFSEQVYKQDRSLWEKIKDWFKDIIGRITAAYKDVSPESEEARMLLEQKELFEEAQKVFAEAIVTAGENYRKASEQSSTGQVNKGDTNAKFQVRNDDESQQNQEILEDQKKYSGKVFYENSEIFSWDFLTSLHNMTVLDMPPLSETKVNGEINQEFVIERGLKNASGLGKKVGENIFEVQNDYSGRQLQIGRHGINHSLDANDIKRLRTNARLALIAGDIVKNAVPINALKKENRQAKGTYAMACLLNNGKGFTVAIVTVNEMQSKVERIDCIDIVHSINGRQQKKTAGLPQGNPDTDIKSAPATAISDIRIANFLEIVNDTHRSILSKDVLKHFEEERPADGYYSDRVLFQLREYSPEEKEQHVADAKNYFGTTYNWKEAGYLLPDGRRLDFSGRHEGAPGGYRTVDHRDITDALGEDYGDGDYSGGMVQFMSEGNIRISPESGGINLSVAPTKDQYDSLSDFISRNRGEVILDLDDLNGNTISSTEYPRGTHANKVIADIKAYFTEGKLPQGSESATAQFRYQERDSAGNELSKEQAEYFKDSKVRDENGKLLVVYHGTRKADFTVFNMTANFYTDSEDVADSYAPNGEKFRGYLDIKNPFIIDAEGEKWSRIPIDSAMKKTLEKYGSSSFKEDGRWRSSSDDIVYAILDGIDEGEFDYDGVIVKNVDDTGGYWKKSNSNVANDYIAFNSNQFKNLDNKIPTSNPDIRYSIREIVGESGKSYGEGVYLDSEMLSGLTDSERVEMVKEYVKELGGKIFSAFDANGKEVSFKVIEGSKHYRNQAGKSVPANKELAHKFIKNKTKQEAIALIDELVITSKHSNDVKAAYSHDWVDNYGKSDWEYWKTYIQDKEKTVWEATLNVTTTANGEKILYDIFPIKNVERSIESDTTSTNKNISQLDDYVKFQERLSVEDRNRLSVLGGKKDRLSKEIAILEKEFGNVIREAYKQNVEPDEGLSERAEKLNAKASFRLMSEVASVFHVPKETAEEFVLPIIAEMVDKGPAISEREGLFEKLLDTAYNHTEDYIVDNDPDGTYKNLRNYIRRTPLFVDSGTKADIGDYNGFRKHNMGSLNLVNDTGALSLDEFYDEVANIAPEFFSHSSDGAEQLYELSGFMKDRGRTESIGDFMPKEEFVSWAEDVLSPEVDKLFDSAVGTFLSEASRKETERKKAAKVQNAFAAVSDRITSYDDAIKEARAEGVLAGQMSQGKAMAKEMRHKAEAYEKAIAKKKEQISEVRARRDELLEKARKEKAEAVAKVRQEARDRLERAIADVKAEKNAQIDALREKHFEKETAIKEKYRDSIKKATEGRHRTLLRGKIKRVVNELNTLLTRQTKEKHVPLELQKPVAEALSILNLDDQSYYESRIKSLESQIADAKTSEQSHILQEELNKVLDHRQSFKDKLEGLRKAYETIEKSADPYIKLGYDSNIAAMIDRVGKDIGDTYLRDMSMTQLEEVYDLYKAVLKTVRDANKFFADEHGASVVQSGFNVIDEIEHGGKTIDEISRGKLNRKKFYWNNLKPVYAFKKLGSKTLEGLFDGVLKGQGTWAKDITEAKTFFERTANKYDYKTWNKKQSFEFTSNTGKTFSLNLQQMMSLYAYSKRDQAYKHLTDGGFVFDNHETIKRKGREYVVNTAKAYNISAETLQQIIGKLSSDQMHFVDEMQKYLSETMGEKGNEISRAMYDINLFGESEYFPLKSAKQFTFDRNEVTSETKKLVNSGFTKPIQPGANNPIILTGFMDVWANHVNDMSMYHAFVLPIENFNKVYNFQMGRSEDYDSKSVKSTIQSTFTSAANDYIEQLIKDINGGARTDSREGTYKKLIGNWKKAAVFASASVVIQQPSAIGRAFAEINAKYFVMPTKVSSYNHKKAWEQIKKYAPVAVIKEMGYFDTDMGQSTADYIKGDKTFMDKADDLLSFAPAVADEYTWSWIWDAVKRETKAKHIDLNVNSEEFLKIAGERFTEIIDRTQVYDSVLSRSGNMRSKGLFMQMLTAFMAEPTTSANMAYQAMLEAKAGHKKKAMAYIGSVGTSVILNTVLVSLIYAMRDDDDDERFEEKYTEAFVKELIDGINPLTYIPFIKDVMSIFQGWDVERVDMSLIADLYDNLDKTIGKFKDLAEGIRDESLSEEEIKASFEEILKEYSLPVLDTLASIVGVPFKNIRRDIVSIFSTYDTFKAHEDLPRSDRFFWDIVHEAAFDQLPFGQYGMESKDDKLFDALSSGDDDYLERLKKGYSSEDAYSNAIRAVIKDGFISGEFGESQSKTFLMNYGGKKLDDAEGIIKSWSFEKKWGFAWSDRADAYATGQISKTRLEKAVTDYTGKTGEDAQKEVDKIVFKSNYGFDYSDRRNEYFDGNITRKQLKKALMDVDGKTSEEADMQIKLYDLQKEGFTEVTEYAVKDYYEFCEPAGIPEDVYFGFFEETKDIKGDYDSKGESIPYSKTKKIMPYINKLPLTAKQKTAIAKSFGWADSTIRKYRLW